MASTRAYRKGKLIAEGFPLEHVSETLELGDCLVWVDLDDPAAEELELLADELQLHPLALADARHARQRPKIDHYDTHLFLAAHRVELDVATGELDWHQVTAFVTANAMVTVHAGTSADLADLPTRWEGDPDLAGSGMGALIYGLLDLVVDTHVEAVDALDDEIEALEDLLFSDRPRDTEVQRRSYQLRKSLVRLRRIAVPMREVLALVLRRDRHLFDAAAEPYVQDVQDHVLRVAESTESLRELVATLLDTNLSVQGNRLNTIMKQVTSWAAIIALPASITGFFGQNVAFPGSGTHVGYWASATIIVVSSLGLYTVFRRREWL